ncbi:S8 family serine peptidase [Tritonibacter mobilis]|uniref:S8 family serine peptidase n=1 Tax=Tritonibacter mobilis TaxID=379347 RepID=UPI0033872406|nr:S8 family serine peptidase [Tritonibacter mobilis]
MAVPNDPLFSTQWHLQNTAVGEYDLNVVDVWDDYTGAGVTIAVIDDGVEATHPDLIANYSTRKDYDLLNSSETIILTPESFPGAGDGSFHGTAVAGIIASVGNNNTGVVGVSYGSTLFGIKLGQELAAPIKLVSGQIMIGGIDRSADIVSMSLGTLSADNFFGSQDSSIETALAMAFGARTGRDGKGTIFVKSAGNERDADNTGTPVTTETNVAAWNATMHSIAVAAVQRTGVIDDYSTPGSSVLISAFGSPGEIVTTDVTGTGYTAGSDYTSGFNGTSASAPQVSGVIALMLEANSNLGWRDVQTILAYSARHVGTEIGTGVSGSEKYAYAFNGADNWNGGGLHFSRDYGFGLVDAKSAVRIAETWGTDFAGTGNQEVASIDLLDTQMTLTGDGTVDRLSGAASTIVEIEHVQLKVDFAQLFDLQDLELRITGPDGTQSIVLDNVSADNDENDTNTLEQWDYFFSNAFRGMSSEGTWAVELIDLDSSGTSPVQVQNVELNFYGSVASDNDTYIFTDEFSDYAGRSSHNTAFDDAAGLDAINAAAVTAASTLNLSEGAGNIDGVSITFSGIENVYTGDGNDNLTGDAGNNVFQAGRGDDTINGGDGIDQAVVLANQSNYSVAINKNGAVTVTDRNASEGEDGLTDIEMIKFADATLDLTQFVSTASLTVDQFEPLAEMYAAYFNRAPDATGLYFWADKLAEGLSLNQIAELFFDQAETRALYTDPSNTDAFVTSVYDNVLGRTPDASGFEFWKSQVSNGSVSQGAFVLEVIGGAKNGGSAEDVRYLSQKTDLGIYFSAIKGMSDVTDSASVFQTFGDASTSNLSGARAAVDQHYADATTANGGDFLFSLIGVIDDPFSATFV